MWEGAHLPAHHANELMNMQQPHCLALPPPPSAQAWPLGPRAALSPEGEGRPPTTLTAPRAALPPPRGPRWEGWEAGGRGLGWGSPG